MPESDVTVSAEFSPVIPAREPYIDESGAYRLGNIEYVEVDGEPFSITEDGTIGEKLDDVTLSYFDFMLRSDREYFVGHSLSLNGDIGVNFYLDLTDREIADGAKVDFAWTVNGTEKTSSVTLSADDKYACGYKATCNVAVAEMTYDVTATLSIGGEVIKTDTYSVKNYADTILTSDDFRTKYIAEKGEEKYDQLVALVKTMLDYGSKAQLTFDRNTDALANGGTDYFTDTVNASDIASTMSNMTENLSSYGLEYTGTTIVYLTETSIRHYYTITDQDTFDLVKDNITLEFEIF